MSASCAYQNSQQCPDNSTGCMLYGQNNISETLGGTEFQEKNKSMRLKGEKIITINHLCHMKEGNRIIKKTDIRTITNIERDVKTGFVTYVCEDGTRIPELEIGNYIKI